MNSTWLFLLVFLYLGLLFLVAFFAEKNKSSLMTNNPYIYALSIAVYCTAWTYYGSIGVAAKQGLSYMTIYIGPIIIIPSWIYIQTRIIRITRIHRISSIADFIALRYGNSRSLAAVISLVCFIAVIPYISLQIKAISDSFHLISKTNNTSLFIDASTYVVLLIAIFASYYGTKYVDASEKRMGIISAVAFESLLKLVFFVILGLYVTYGVFNGFQDIYKQAKVLEDFKSKNTIGGLSGAVNWMLMCLLSISAIFLLPRQFHTTIIENRKEKFLNTVLWLFPLYLLIFNLFVFPIAWGGNILFKNENVNPDMYSLLIPEKLGNHFMSVLVFLGGISSSISMIIVSSISLSIMMSNNIIIPYGVLERFKIDAVKNHNHTIVRIRKVSIFVLIILAFIFYKLLINSYSLFSIGLISFVIIAQLAPSFFGAIFWKRGSYLGSLLGIIAGVMITLYKLILPYLLNFKNLSEPLLFLKKQIDFCFSNFSIPYLDPITECFFWSLLVNTIVFMGVSVSRKANYRERNFAEIYVEIDQYINNHENAYIWKGTAYVQDIEKILIRFLGEEKTARALKLFFIKYNISNKEDTADARLIKFSENLLAGHIGTASSKILIEGVTKEDKISLLEVLEILEESKENINTNKKLTEQAKQLERLSNDLQKANDNLLEKDKQKDEFLDIVAHELRTPITSIRMAGEILQDDADMPLEVKMEFLDNIISESDRISELINDILFLDQLNTEKIELKNQNIIDSFQLALKPLLIHLERKKITISIQNSLQNPYIWYNEQRLIQVFNNLLGNAIKFCSDDHPSIEFIFSETENQVKFSILNNGDLIPETDIEWVFDKFFQSKNQRFKKREGTGLGLSICQKIIELHNGTIAVKNKENGVEFYFHLPKINNQSNFKIHEDEKNIDS